MKLTAARVKAAETRAKEYKLADGGGLHLLVKPTGCKYWRLKYRFGGKEKQLALGVHPEISLARARGKCQAARDRLDSGIDPRIARRLDKITQAQEGESTFKGVGLDTHSPAHLWL